MSNIDLLMKVIEYFMLYSYRIAGLFIILLLITIISVQAIKIIHLLLIKSKEKWYGNLSTIENLQLKRKQIFATECLLTSYCIASIILMNIDTIWITENLWIIEDYINSSLLLYIGLLLLINIQLSFKNNKIRQLIERKSSKLIPNG
ncbi:hypothetical protein [Oceanobacillus timonensis]|uniref:hypothetical protein n=1 Tax=Oceanobacillus timonensis TaxID=1926285 RepID=UPI0009B9C3A5|nr:hypothetical protein [Oceanobacillus timonensis]